MVTCNICAWQGQNFENLNLDYGRIYRQALCPSCKSQPRHRSIYRYITKNNIIPTKEPLKLLHFAPEKVFTDLFQSYKNIDYLSVDINPKKAMRSEDITHLSFDDSSFDILFCVHVLEHVINDMGAIREMHRVLKNDGFAFIDVPINPKLEKTYEDPNITSPEERAKAFWQWNHLRLYGADFNSKLNAAGFKIKPEDFVVPFKEEDIMKYGLESKLIYRYVKK